MPCIGIIGLSPDIMRRIRLSSGLPGTTAGPCTPPFRPSAADAKVKKHPRQCAATHCTAGPMSRTTSPYS